MTQQLHPLESIFIFESAQEEQIDRLQAVIALFDQLQENRQLFSQAIEEQNIPGDIVRLILSQMTLAHIVRQPAIARTAAATATDSSSTTSSSSAMPVLSPAAAAAIRRAEAASKSDKSD